MSEDMPKQNEEPTTSSNKSSIGNLLSNVDSLTAQFPQMNFDATVDTIRGSILENTTNLNSIKNFALGCASLATDMVNANAYPVLNNILAFTRNSLILDKIYHSIAAKMTVETNSNSREWNNCNIRCKTKFHSDRLMSNEFHVCNCGVLPICGVFWKEMRNAMLSTNGIIECNFSIPHSSGNQFIVDYISNYKVASINENGIATTDEKSDAPFAIAHFANRKYPDAVPYGYFVIFGDKFATEDKQYMLGVSSFVLFYAYSHTCTYSCSDMFADSIESVNNHLEYKSFDVTTRALAISYHGAINYSMPHTPYNSLHVSDKFNEIANGMINNAELGRSRGYAFVGYPGTGKSVMMRQLVDIMREHHYPAVKFPAWELLSCDSGVGERGKIKARLMEDLAGLKRAGYNHVVIFCDDIESYDLHEKNENVDMLLSIFDRFSMFGTVEDVCDDNGTFDHPTVTFLVTINNPKAIHGTVIKRSCRIDEVIKIDLPDADRIRQFFEFTYKELTGCGINTNKFSFKRVFKYMVKKHISIADITNIIKLLQIYYHCTTVFPTAKMLRMATDKLCESRENADTNYDSV